MFPDALRSLTLIQPTYEWSACSNVSKFLLQFRYYLPQVYRKCFLCKLQSQNVKLPNAAVKNTPPLFATKCRKNISAESKIL